MAGVETLRSVGILKILFLLHLILSAWSLQAVFADHPDSYIYYNVIFMAALAWAITSKSGIEAASLAILVGITCSVLDILTLSLYWRAPGGGRVRVYLGFAIANAVLRPITGFALYQVFKDRDVEGVGFRGAFADIIGPMGPVQSSSTPQQSSSGPTGYQAV